MSDIRPESWPQLKAQLLEGWVHPDGSVSTNLGSLIEDVVEAILPWGKEQGRKELLAEFIERAQPCTDESCWMKGNHVHGYYTLRVVQDYTRAFWGQAQP